VYLLVERFTSLPATALASALAWQNDRLFVFASTIPTTSASTTLVWQLDFTTEQDASLFVGTLGASSFTTARAGNRVTIARTSTGAPVPWAVPP
jgi:hypothetical protein